MARSKGTRKRRGRTRPRTATRYPSIAVSADLDDIVFRLAWRGGPARLIELLDNYQPVAVVDSRGPTWRYHAAPDPGTDSHFIQWHLFAPGQTLTDLEASAIRNGADVQVLARSAKEGQDWIGEGELV